MKGSGKRVQDWRKRVKKLLVESFGGKCNKCGYSDCIEAFDFHHLDPASKSFTLASALKNPRSWEKVMEEAKMCIMICCRCHRELHSGLWTIDEIQSIRFQEAPAMPPSGKCQICGKPTYYGAICCSRTCAGKKRVEWPEDVMFLEMFETNTVTQVAAKLGASITMVQKKRKMARGKGCPICKKKFLPQNKRQKYCSQKCFSKSQRKVERPSPSKLRRDISRLSFVAIGKKYGVSDNAVRKWARQYKLI